MVAGRGGEKASGIARGREIGGRLVWLEMGRGEKSREVAGYLKGVSGSQAWSRGKKKTGGGGMRSDPSACAGAGRADRTMCAAPVRCCGPPVSFVYVFAFKPLRAVFLFFYCELYPAVLHRLCVCVFFTGVSSRIFVLYERSPNCIVAI